MTRSAIDAHRADDVPAVTFGRMADGLLVARVGDTAFAMIPGRDGRHYLATGWRVARSLAEWTRADFYGHAGELANEAAFRASVEENALHQQQRAALSRQEVFSRAHTPWGVSQGATRYADGVVSHSTAGHGGFHLSPDRNAKVHWQLRAADGFYEEDCCWVAVALAFTDLFTDFEKACAEPTFRDNFPDVWEGINGRQLQPGESREKDRASFFRDHAQHWIVVSAISSAQRPDFVEAVAVLGGQRDRETGSRRYLIPRDEYPAGSAGFGFVIDEARHRRYAGPSSFIGRSA